MQKPELLLPVGSTENYFAAVKGGADAVYLGLKNFNARGRATNFQPNQLLALVKDAQKNNVRVYVTLNTVIKNKELPELLDTLFFLTKAKVSAVIIQDWGIYYLIKRHFPSLNLHASTQMGNHNSLGGEYSKGLGFERIILAREISFPELKAISKNTSIDLEVFTHGALCYSFSGMCLFSSYIGGAGANRGICTQPCRRIYKSGNRTDYTFSLKDNQLIEYIPEISKLGISSVKVEGRMKAAEYVYRVAKAYRMMIDDPSRLDEAAKLLTYDMGREKTAYFFGGDVSKSISHNPNTGIFIGKILSSQNGKIVFGSNLKLEDGNRIRIRSPKGENRTAVKLRNINKDSDGNIVLSINEPGVQNGDRVFLAGLQQEKFPNRFGENPKSPSLILPRDHKYKILRTLKPKLTKSKTKLFVRIGNIAWLRKIRLDDMDYLVLRLSKREWQDFKSDSPFIQKNKKKIIIDLPKFISETEIAFYKNLCKNFYNNGFNHFMISHLSQKLLLPPKAVISTNENVLLYNDAAIAQVEANAALYHTNPHENDYENMLAGSDRNGIVSVYYYPELFYSRMPVKLDREESSFKDDRNMDYQRTLRNGITVILPSIPVSLTHYHDKLIKDGFKHFMIDLSGEKVSKNVYHRIITKFKHNEQIQPSNTFNFKKGLK